VSKQHYVDTEDKKFLLKHIANMQINNEILHAFINCQYKAYKKSKLQRGNISDYEIFYNELKQTQKINFEKKLLENNKQISSNSALTLLLPKAGFY
jgi:hypothetical protein